MSPFGLPKLPGIGESPFSVVGNFAKEGIGGIKKLEKDIDEALGTIDKEFSGIGTLDKEEKSETAGSREIEGVSDDSTYRFQLDLMIDNVTDLETVHLPNQGRINGQSCDCIAKHARILRAHAKETVPIASRQGRDSRLFNELSQVADVLMSIGTKQAVDSGKYDDEYLQYAGTMSNYRKKLEDLLGQSHITYTAQCATCPSTLNLKAFIDKRKKEEAREKAKAIQETSVPSETETQQ